jgi:hypothetical protein
MSLWQLYVRQKADSNQTNQPKGIKPKMYKTNRHKTRLGLWILWEGRLGCSEPRVAQSSRLKVFVTCGDGGCHIGWRPLWLGGRGVDGSWLPSCNYTAVFTTQLRKITDYQSQVQVPTIWCFLHQLTLTWNPSLVTWCGQKKWNLQILVTNV